MDKFFQIGLQTQHVTGQFHTGDVILLTFSEIDRDENILFIRRNGYLNTIDLEVKVTIIHVVRTNGFNIRGEFLARI